MHSHCKCEGHTMPKLTQWYFIAEFVNRQESVPSFMHNNAISNWLFSDIKAAQTVLKIFKMAVYALGGPIYLTDPFSDILPCFKTVRKIWILGENIKIVIHRNMIYIPFCVIGWKKKKQLKINDNDNGTAKKFRHFKVTM